MRKGLPDETTDEIHIEQLMSPRSQTINDIAVHYSIRQTLGKAHPSRKVTDIYNWQEFPKSEMCEGYRMFTCFSSVQSPGHEPDMPLATGHINHLGGEPRLNWIKPQFIYLSLSNPDTRYLEPDTYQGE